MTNWAREQEHLQEMAWSSADAAWEGYVVLANELTSVEQYSYTRRITFKRDGKLWQFVATMGHDGDHEYGEPYEVEAFSETVTKYRKPDRGNQADRPVQRPALPATYADPRGGCGKWA